VRIVLDTDVMIAAIRSDSGASRQLIRLCLQQRCTLLISVPLVVEYEAVMTRPEHLATAGLTASDVGSLLDAIVMVGKPVRLAFLWRPMLKDPNDDMVLETAVNGQAHRIVTFNRRDFGNVAQRFGIAVCLPGETLGVLESQL
jgi:putative PIN family toxin of toxin-antitoxin system